MLGLNKQGRSHKLVQHHNVLSMKTIAFIIHEYKTTIEESTSCNFIFSYIWKLKKLIRRTCTCTEFYDPSSLSVLHYSHAKEFKIVQGRVQRLDLLTPSAYNPTLLESVLAAPARRVRSQRQLFIPRYWIFQGLCFRLRGHG